MTDKMRADFETWVSAPPIEASVKRWGADETIDSWPLEYRDYSVQLAWEAWKEASNNKQAKIDALMLEFCPDEMTPEQLENWEKHQRLSDITEENSND